MENLGWGLVITVAGMGTVFAMLALLWGLLFLLGRLDRQPAPATGGGAGAPKGGKSPAPKPAAKPALSMAGADGLDDDAIAAIAVAVITHAHVRRQQAAPAMRVRQPGTQMHTSRWVVVGRANQSRSWTRS